MIEHFISNYQSLKTNGFFDNLQTLSGPGDFYLSYPIAKSNGSRRWIDAPQHPLLGVQSDILHNLLYKFKAHECAVGFINDIGVEHGAEKHLDSNVLLNMDIKKFFPSISGEHITDFLSFLAKRLPKFQSLKGQAFTKEDKAILRRILLYKGSVPQGAPTSPAVANLVMYNVDKHLKELADHYGLVYTRYADDMSFSHKDKDFDIKSIIGSVELILRSYKFKVNTKKTRIMRPHQRMVVTGVVVNDKLSVPKWKWRNFRAKLHNLTMKGEPISKFEWQQLKGYCEWIRNLHPQRGQRFLKKLGKIPRQD